VRYGSDNPGDSRSVDRDYSEYLERKMAGLQVEREAEAWGSYAVTRESSKLGRYPSSNKRRFRICLQQQQLHPQHGYWTDFDNH
jgi:hypothetical protein